MEQIKLNFFFINEQVMLTNPLIYLMFISETCNLENVHSTNMRYILKFSVQIYMLL